MDDVMRRQLEEKLELIKQDGIEAGEEAAKKAIKYVFELANVYVFMSSNKWDDMLAVLFPIIEKELLNMADKINPED